jgi:formimidoylglutamate deiminase
MRRIQPEWVLTADGLRTGWCVEVDRGQIVGLQAEFRHPEVVKMPGCLLVPGFVNAHSHAFQRAFRGHVQWRDQGEDDFWSWRHTMYAVANGLEPEGVEAVSRLAFLEMAEAGITAVGEFHYLHHEADGGRYGDPDELAKRVIAAATSVGVRICLLRVAYGRNEPGVPLRSNQRRFGDRDPEAVLDAIGRLRQSDDPLVSVGLAPHSVRAVPPDWLPVLSAFDGVVHSHVSEQPREVALCRAEQGTTPVGALAAAGLVSDRFTGVHLTHPAPEDLRILRERDAAVCVCPSTELDLGDGFYPLEARDGMRLCIGSDSQSLIEPVAEARAVEYHGRALAGRRNVMATAGVRDSLSRRILDIASVEGARCLGMDSRGIAIGSAADFTILDCARPAACGVPPLEAAAFVSDPSWVRSVWVNGVEIVSEGHHPRRQEIVAAAQPHISKVLAGI